MRISRIKSLAEIIVCFDREICVFFIINVLTMSTTCSKGVFLEVDPTIVERNLLFTADPSEEDFNQIFKTPGDEFPSKLVKPFPGFCIKTREVGADTKFFINICHTDSIPPPKDITERQLSNILDSDEITDFRVPMSIGEVRTEKDKQGEEARVSDVAINPNFFKKIEQSQLFKSFFVTIVFEGLKEKHGIICQDEKIILKNRKTFGTLQVHRIQQREIDEKMKNVKNNSLIEEIVTSSNNTPKPFIEEISTNSNSKKSTPLLETAASEVNKPRVPEYQLFRRKEKPNTLIGEFVFPDVISGKELLLDIGEDRIVIESTSKNYLLDIFVPLVIRQAGCTSTFNKSSKILTVTMPLVGG